MQRKLLFFTAMILAGSWLISCKEDPIPPPAITSFEPASGVVGTTITITGTGFEGTAANNLVKFNGTTASVTASTATSITTTVPTGSTTGPITVTAREQTATSATSIRIDALFMATLSGASESSPNTSTATGTSNLVFNLETKIFTVVTTFSGLTPSNGHIHKGAIGVSGSVVFPFSNVAVSPITYTSIALTAAQETDLNAELYYTNLHTTAFGAGEIRGQLLKQ